MNPKSSIEDNMDHTSFNLHSTGAFLRVPPEKHEAYGLAAQLITLLNPPLSAPFAVEIVKLLLSSVKCAVAKLEGPTAAAIRVVDNFNALVTVMATADQNSESSTSHLSLRGKC